MKNMKKIVIFLTVLALAFSLTAGLAGCKDGNGDNGGNGAAVEHKVAVRTAGGMAMEGVAVSVYTDEALSNLQGYSQTNAEGVATISLPEGGTYYISLSISLYCTASRICISFIISCPSILFSFYSI